MPFRRRRSSGRRSRSPKGIKEWSFWETLDPTTLEHRAFTLSPGGRSDGWLIAPSTARDEYDEPTVIRLLFRHWAIAAMPNIALGDFEASFWSGLIVTRGNPEDTVPLIDTSDGGLDWLYWNSTHFTSFFTSLGVATRRSIDVLPADFGPYGGVIDIRTKRRIPGGYGLLYTNVAAPAPDNFGCSVVGYTSGRLLLVNH